MSTALRAGQISMAEKDHANVTIGKALRAVRTSAGMSMSELSKASRVPQTCIQNAEVGNGLPAHSLAFRAEALDCTVDDFVPTEATTCLS